MFGRNFRYGIARRNFIFRKRCGFCGKFRFEIAFFVCGDFKRFGIRSVLLCKRNGNFALRGRESPNRNGLVLLEHHKVADDFRKAELINGRAGHIQLVTALRIDFAHLFIKRRGERKDGGKSKCRGAKRRKRKFDVIISIHFFSSKRKRQQPPRARRACRAAFRLRSRWNYSRCNRLFRAFPLLRRKRHRNGHNRRAR